MYWPSPEESDVSHCESTSSHRSIDRCNTDRRSTCRPLTPMMETPGDDFLVSHVDQFSTSGPTPEVTKDHSEQQWRSLPGDAILSSSSASHSNEDTTDNVTKQFVGVDIHPYRLSN